MVAMAESNSTGESIEDKYISHASSTILFAATEDSIFQEASKHIQKCINNKENTDVQEAPEDGEIIEYEKARKEELQKQVQCGEITPFQALRKEQTQARKDGLHGQQTNKEPQLLNLEKYLKQQAELAIQKKQRLQQKHKNANHNEQCLIARKKVKLSNEEQSISYQKKHRQEQNDLNANSLNVPSQRINSSRISKRQTTGHLETVIEENKAIPEVSCEATDKQETTKIIADTATKDVCNSDSDYVPSDDNSDPDESKQKHTSRKKNSVKSQPGKSKRILDDGDEASYQYRIKTGGYNKKKQAFHRVDNLFKVPKVIWKRLYKYQKVSVQWLWELHGRGLGGLLGDEMGLGKTVQVIAFLAGLDFSELLSDGGRFRGLGPTLIVCPATLIEQWVMHFHDWWPILRVAVLHQAGTYDGDVNHLLHSLKESGGVLVTSYSGVLIHKDILVRFQWHYVILDEGHKIRNPEAKVTKAVKAFTTPHRLLLTGSPMQNSLKELWSLFDFIIPGKLGTFMAFLEHVANPITRGGYANASALQEATALQVATILKDAITPYMLRRTKTDVQHHVSLPQKNEQVLFCSLTEEQKHLYKTYLRTEDVACILRDKSDASGRYRARLLIALSCLRKICNHPDLYLYTQQLDSDEDVDENSLTEESLNKFGYWKRSGKMSVVRSLLKIWKKQNHRALLFTQGRQMMHILESLLQNEKYTYLRMDGTTPMSQRQQTINLFNENPSYFIFLLTTRVGGLGVNLTGANRVIIYDPDWNPATDTQARERAWRIGQDKRVTIYRLITAGTIEEKMYHRQIFKLLLSSKVLEDPRQRRLFKTSDLAELFHLNECITGESSESDRLFRESKLMPAKKSSTHKTEFSQSKVEEMRKLASTLSKAMTHSKANVSAFENNNSGQTLDSTTNDSNIAISSVENKDTSVMQSDCSSEVNTNVEVGQQSKKMVICKKKKRHNKASNKEDGDDVTSAMFEGERVTYLIGRRLTKTAPEDEEISVSTEEDHYVLKKLFAKSTVSSAFQHESVLSTARDVNDNTSITPMQRLARETAQQNMDFVRQSRKWCWKPTWEQNSSTKDN